MIKKYKLTKEKREIFGRTLYRIKALKDFNIVKKGELGGWIESEYNLSQEGNCWVSGNAKVFENSRVSGNAKVFENSRVSGNASVSGNARVYENAIVSENARVYENAIVSENARVYENAIVSGNARVYENAIVSGNASVSGNAKVFEDHRIITGFITKSLENLKYSFMAQIGFYPTDEFILYKRVNKIKEGKYSSCYDKDFIYEDGKFIEVKNPDLSNKSCSTGIHLSNPLYWDVGDTIIACQVKWEDVITIQEGKVRVKKCYVIGEVNDF